MSLAINTSLLMYLEKGKKEENLSLVVIPASLEFHLLTLSLFDIQWITQFSCLIHRRC
jgi:hypothetical protein